jgi:geranylgeranylglycerol-phosphate geranylgeranyltransferase
MARLPAAIEILRPHNMLAAALGVVAGYVAAGGQTAGPVVPTAIVTAFATGAGNVINDYFDRLIDAVNKPRRPLPSGRMSPRGALVLYVVIAIAVAVAAVAWLPRGVAVVVVVWELALVAYARVLKRTWLLGNISVGVVTSSVFLAGAMVAGRPAAAGIPMAIAFGFVMCREIVKGGEDVDGDRAAGVQTLAVAAGRGRAACVAACAMLVVAALIPAPAVARVYAPAYLFVMEAFVVPALVFGALAIDRRPERPVFARVSQVLKLAMFAGIVAIALGA